MIGRRAPAVVALLLAGALAGCGSSGDGASPASSSTMRPPPTAGVMPWGGDLQGFGDRKQVRCDGEDQAVRMAWLEDDRFLICRTAGSGERYLRAWTADGPGMPNEQGMKLHRGVFFTLTDSSLQFMTEDGAKFDIGRDAMTIEWPREPGSTTKEFSTLRTGEGWSRLD